MKSEKLGRSLMLVLTALIWGVAFVAQSVSMDYIEPFTFNAVRCAIGAIVLLPIIAIFGRNKKESIPKTKKFSSNKSLIIGGICCGIALCVAANLQQFGVKYTTVGKAGFITAMYIIIVPLIGIFFKKKVSLNIWISVIIAIVGLYLLCMSESFALKLGDVLILISAVVFSIHILIIDHFSPKTDGVKLSCIQFATCAVLSAAAMLIFEKPNIAALLDAWVPILYAGIMSCGVAYTLQILGQKNMDPTVASLILSLESVFSVIAGFVVLGQKMTTREIIGCAVMFLAIVLAQIPVKELKVKNRLYSTQLRRK